ncbi:tRNA lysidine(34) synthetase TilS [Dyadobacter fermentans]|uniref:tRNA(Ile)-lysidine synthase n=1 Tax=Dyadobacter fermentans (strain ATCC 700827 / DSM 18053 / CIP 107007 / KCTC 52180 / NS114) TaxID=471854 RepID=C6VSI0_DYAFD|nr:tRNA lysidine(34) synthetase TilS [Dyadobacter fermentans]ACT96415.1 tRNA(Ile)-lysidine synthetase [Dyadobacter fermentans DSM 18053]
MLDSFLTFINQHTPDLKHQPTLLAVSGGIDSVVMVHLFHEQGLPAGIAHCNFGLRGEESNADEAFVRALAARCNFPVFVSDPDVKTFSKSHSISTQMAARELRYEWFEEIRRSSGYGWIATAHHSNDSLETLLLNLARGTGLPGMCGIAPVRDHLIRPLILSNRAEVRRYAEENGITWREDRSNASDDYQRNKVRHHVVPVLTDLNPSLETTFNASAERLRAANTLLDEYLGAWKSRIMRDSGGSMNIPIDEILGKSEPIYRLWYILQDFGFLYSQVRAIAVALHGKPGKQFHSPTHVLLIDRALLILKAHGEQSNEGQLLIEDTETPVEWLGMTLCFEKLPSAGALDSGPFAIAVDANRLTFPLMLRKWRPGDIFQPFGMAGRSKKVSDLLIDRKIDRFEKDRIVVLLDGNGEIIWVVGQRADERFRVGETAQEILKISIGAS